MKFNVTLDMEDLWLDNEDLAQYIIDEIKSSIQAEVRKEIRSATKDVLADYHKEIKAAGKQYGKRVLEALLKENNK